MKRIVSLSLVLALAVFAAFAKPVEAAKPVSESAKPLMAPGNLALTAGLGYGIFFGALDLSAGAEMVLGQFVLADSIPLTYGAAVKGVFYRYSYGGFGSEWYYSYIGAGAFGTLHLSLKDIPGLGDNEFLNKVDTYIGLGVGLYGYHYSYYDVTDDFFVGFRSTGGFNYFLTPNFAINLEGGYYGGWGGGLIGVLLKL